MLVNGVWEKKWDPVQQKDKDGRFVRQSSAFRDTLDAATVAEMKAAHERGEAPRFALYVAYICPWATRTLIARELLGLQDYLPVYVVDPRLTDEGWRFDEEGEQFPGSSSAQQAGVSFMHELYTRTDSQYTGRATVPVLWDTQEQRIVNNESAEILRIFNNELKPLHAYDDIDLSPEALLSEIDAFNESIYDTLNNGVYRAGFASSQQAYREAYNDVFATLDRLEEELQGRNFVVGDQLTESDIRLYVTLSRFDVAYHGLFKTNRSRIADYSNLSRWMEQLLEIPAFANNTRVDHIKAGYYSIEKLNPPGIVPDGPQLPWFRHLKAGV